MVIILFGLSKFLRLRRDHNCTLARHRREKSRFSPINGILPFAIALLGPPQARKSISVPVRSRKFCDDFCGVDTAFINLYFL